MRRLEQVPGDEGRRFAAAQQDLAVLAMQRLMRWPRNHIANSAAQELVPEREGICSCGYESGPHHLLYHGQQRGRRFAEHLGRVLHQPERGSEHGRCHQQVPGRLSEVIEPPLRDLVNPLRQLSGNQHSAVIDDVHGVSSYCQDLWIKIV